MTALYALIALSAVAISSRRKFDILGPGSVYIVVYSILLAVNSFHLSRYQAEWTAATKALFWGATFSFLGGCFIVQIYGAIANSNKVHPSFEQIRAKLRMDARYLNWSWFINVWGAITILFLGAFADAVYRTGMVPVFATDPDSERFVFIRSSILINHFWMLGPISLMLGLEYLLFSQEPKTRRLVVGAISAVTFLAYLSLLMRLDVMRFFVVAAVLYHYGIHKLTVKRMVVFLLLVTFFFGGALAVRLGSQAVSTLSTYLRLSIPEEYVLLSNVYAYVANNFWNMNYAVQRYVEGYHGYNWSWGYELFRPVFYLLRVEEVLQDARGFDSVFNESVDMISGFNSVVYVWHFYKDFGALGVYGLSLGAGVALAVFHYNFTVCPTLMRATLWGIFAGFIVFSFLVPLWNFFVAHLGIVAIVIAHWGSTRRAMMWERAGRPECDI